MEGDRVIRQQLNTLLTDTYRGILKFEEQLVTRNRKLGLTIGEIHTIEVIGKAGEDGMNISQIAKMQSLTSATVVVSINRLEEKGYVRRERDTRDRRHVYVKLTKRGKAVSRLHESFHMNMVDHLVAGLSAEDKEALVSGVHKLHEYFARMTDGQ